MCSMHDVLEATYRSAACITFALCNYGDGDLGEGIRKLHRQSGIDMIPYAYGKGYAEGECDGFKKGLLTGGTILGGCLLAREVYKKRKEKMEETTKTDHSEIKEGENNE